MTVLPKLRLKQGDTLIGVLIALGIFAIMSQAVISLVLTSYDLVSYTRARTNARHIAAEKVELFRNLPYSDVGTVGGIPAGAIPQIETVIRNGLNYRVYTSIIYIDDPFDGQSPSDLLPTDYKRVRIDVSWGGTAPSKSDTVTLISDVSPRGVETSAGGGTLSILVFNSNGEPVPQAQVQIQASSLNPAIDLTQQTNDDGIIILPGAPSCNSCYRITATKDGYSTDRTYSTTEITNPDKNDPSVLVGQLTQVSFAIDSVGKMNITSTNDRDSEFAVLPSQTIHVQGEKTIGTTQTGDLVYKFDQDITTDSSGLFTIENIEWDNYHITPGNTSSNVIAGTNPISPIPVSAGEEINLKIALSTPSTPQSLLAIFVDSEDDPIASVSARITTIPDYEATASSGLTDDPDYGQIFFKDLSQSTYTLEASASGFLNFTGNIVVNNHHIEKIFLSPE